jgi:copper homeostasis protein
MEFEACVESLEGALLAQKYGAHRIELCSALNEGGLSPSSALLKQVKANCSLDIFAMIRPVAGGFQYSEMEIQLMLMEIEEMAKGGAKGVVFGLLNSDASFDIEANARLIAKAKEHKLIPVCHRAFDFNPKPQEALEEIIALGFKRLLTSGLEPKAISGLSLIKELHLQAQGRIELMAGSGVMPENIVHFMESKIDAVHFTVGTFEEGLPLGMGARLLSDQEKVKAIMSFKE